MARLPMTPVCADPVAATLRELPDPAGAALERILAPLRRSTWPEVAWGFSTLTASGCPLELSFNTADPCVRYTAEVAGPEVDHHDRLALAAALVTELTEGQDLPDGLAAELAGLQRSGELHWGAWVGGRHRGDRSSYKVYAEMPRDVEAPAWFPAMARLGHRQPHLEGVGHEVGSGLTELYFRLTGLDVADTGALLDAAGLGARHRDLLDLMATVYGRPMTPHLPGHPFGVSVVLLPGAGPVAVSVFGYTIDVLGDDAAARWKLLRAAPRLGWDADRYRRLTAPLAHRHDAPTRHSVGAFTVTRGDAPAALTVGVAAA